MEVEENLPQGQAPLSPDRHTSLEFSTAQPDEEIESLFGGRDDKSEQDHGVDSGREKTMDGNGCRMEEEEEEEEEEREVAEEAEDDDENEDEEEEDTHGSRCDFGLSDGQEQLFLKMATDPYYCAADDESQATHVRTIVGLNDCVNQLVISILSRFDKWIEIYYSGSTFADFKNSKDDANQRNPLLRAFSKLKTKRRRLEVRRMVLEAHMVERILSTIHEAFFAGDVFFGLMDATQINILDQMYYVMLKNEPWIVVQRWRSFSSAASIWTLDETCLANIVEDLATEIETSITTLYPTTNKSFHKKLPDIVRNANESSKTMLKAVKLAHKLSRDLQHDCVSARLKVIMGPIDERRGNGALLAFSPQLTSLSVTSGRAGRPGDAVLSTTAFGLESFEGEMNIHRVLMKPKVVTIAVLE